MICKISPDCKEALLSSEGSRRNLGRALINERCMAKPVTPLTRLWIEKLALPKEAQA